MNEYLHQWHHTFDVILPAHRAQNGETLLNTSFVHCKNPKQQNQKQSKCREAKPGGEKLSHISHFHNFEEKKAFPWKIT